MEEHIYQNVCILGIGDRTECRNASIAEFAIDFFLKENSFSIPKNKLKIIFSYDFTMDQALYHRIPNPDENPNATVIPVYFQTDKCKEDGYAVIIVNMKKLNEIRANDYFVCSSIVHELTHYYDFEILYKELQNEYGFSLDEIWEHDLTKYHKQICNLFQAYSEIHAKYMQEKYYLTNYHKINLEHYLNEFYKHLPVYNKKEQYSDYDIQHTVGCLQAWKELFTNEKQLEKVDKRIKNYLNKMEPDKKWKIYFELTSEENLHKAIQQIQMKD